MIHDNANVGGDARGCGELLREAREAAGLELREVATRLRMPVHVVEALEQGRWEVIGAPVFVRGQLRSYARLLGVDLEPLLQVQVAPPAPVELVSHVHTPRLQRLMENVGRRAVYVVITAAIAVPVWLATRSHFAGQLPTTASLDVLPAEVADAPATTAPEAPPVQAPRARPQAQAGEAGPYVASLAPPVRQQAPAPAPALELSFEGDSWIEVTGPDGRVIEQRLARQGETRSFQPGEVAGVVLGNAAAVRVQQAGSIVDLSPFRRANVARFAVSSDGSVKPAQ
ncbi:helix-turn-helix domain-containing protein [Pseudoxanthomonas sp. SGNA-20]|uniref:Cytoskeleton protein RodZ n=1 Tax=Pseudoxanthomonas taiwanensis J19 TaxID=935569 RepID=A0A562D6S5_9GAMM|nr:MULTISPECIES: helix-turn-helix domain-containing protein [Pseudoxanthomonas]RRN54734.1 helix-turn-helix domain-containing protein [Pseudoxanthomonas sp. SGNA-20]RRN78451.1 helix-turn-helix domain-containing protein [Pseudoxanthomonas sp. SGD-10]TWH05423.1 cytoskeleton protein RodZ [Pseudoxanthomonas taiwanensis J19]